MKLSRELKKVIAKVFNPIVLIKVLKLQKDRKKLIRTRNDAQLKLYSEILTGDFLHYGYFKNPDTQPEDISFSDIEKAQYDYAKLFLDRITDRESPILDVGCGMGGLSNMLHLENLTPVALTPDVNQIEYIKNKYPHIKIINGTFEETDTDRYTAHFGTLVTSESLQYLKLDPSLDIINKILKKDGEWLACDYFRKGTAHEKSGHIWESFQEKIDEKGFTIVYEQDITPNILVTLKYVYMWAVRIGVPIMNFTIEKMKLKQPGFHYLFADIIGKITGSIDDNIEVINPERFQEEKKYIFLVIKRKADMD